MGKSGWFAFPFLPAAIPQCFTASWPAAYSSLPYWPGMLGCGPPVAYHVNLPPWCESLDIQSCTVLGFVCSSDKAKWATQSWENPQLSRPNKFFYNFLVFMVLTDQEYLAILMLQVMACYFLSIRNIWSRCNYIWGYLLLVLIGMHGKERERHSLWRLSVCLFDYLLLGLNSAHICWGFLWAIMLQYHDTWQVSQ